MTETHSARPLSPHVGIYRWQISNTLSILHRATGCALSVGTMFFAAWLWAAAYDGAYFRMWQHFYASPLGIAMLVGWSAAFYYHLGNGIRHLFWDTGRGFSIPNMTRSGIANLVFVVIATAATWLCVYQQFKG